MSRAVIGLEVHTKSGQVSRTIKLLDENDKPIKLSTWSIESVWLYVVANGQRRAVRLYPGDDIITEIHGEEQHKGMKVP